MPQMGERLFDIWDRRGCMAYFADGLASPGRLWRSGVGFCPAADIFAHVASFFERPARCDLYYTILYTVIVVVALFMDGYNFVMFAVASSGIACLTLINNGLTKRTLFRLGWHVLSFSLAYVLYKAYVGEMPIKEMPENLFHAMGMDIAFWALPSQGMLWLADALGVSVPRNPRNYWGDISIWASFYLPLFCTGCWGFWRIRRNRLAVLLLLIAVFALWMSLGPVFKFNDMIPEVISEGWESNIPRLAEKGMFLQAMRCCVIFQGLRPCARRIDGAGCVRLACGE